MEFSEVTDRIGQVFEAVGVAIIALGGAYALLTAPLRRTEGRSILDAARVRFGGPLLLGLEVLIAADIIETVTVDRTLENVASLGLLVLIRVVLSFSLETELEGVLPWHRWRRAPDDADET